MDNIILLSDSYKVSHWRQYPPGTEYVYSYLESRGCDRPGWDNAVFFGLQYFLKKYLVGQVVTREKIDEAEKIYADHFGNPTHFYKEGWEYILEKHGGRLPVKIKAIPEGMVVPLKTVLITAVNTDPNCFWLTNFLETLLVQVWYPMAVCTNSRNQKLSIQKYLEETGCEDWKPPGGTAYKLHDFGFRGVSSVESAAVGGAAHLVNFMGTDTVAALVACSKYYHAQGAAGHSIPASEHSTITSWGVQGEVDAMRNMLMQYPDGLVACVSDSFDVYRACREYWGGALKDLIKGRITEHSFGRLVVRPDSGDPADTCTEILNILCEQFKEDVKITSTGHRLLPPYIRVIQGDGVDFQSIPKILQRLKDEGLAADNLGFGSGGALLQRLDRDTLKVAFKCSEIVINGEPREVFKDPITDNGKGSKKGRLTLQPASDFAGCTEEEVYKPRQGEYGVKGGTGYLHFSKDGQYVTVASGMGDETRDILVEVFCDGELKKDWTLDEIRRRADIPNGPFSQPAVTNGDVEALAAAVEEREYSVAQATDGAAPVASWQPHQAKPLTPVYASASIPAGSQMLSPVRTSGAQPVFVTTPASGAYRPVVSHGMLPSSPVYKGTLRGPSYVAAPPGHVLPAGPHAHAPLPTGVIRSPTYASGPPARLYAAPGQASYVAAAPPGGYTVGPHFVRQVPAPAGYLPLPTGTQPGVAPGQSVTIPANFAALPAPAGAQPFAATQPAFSQMPIVSALSRSVQRVPVLPPYNPVPTRAFQQRSVSTGMPGSPRLVA